MEYEDRRTIATPEGVQLALPLANLGTRFLSTLIDLLIAGTVAIVVILCAGIIGGEIAATIAGAASFLILYVGYHVIFEVAGGGRTIGRRAAGLRVVMDSGAPVGLRASLIRNIIRILEGIALMYVPAIIAILSTKNNQRLGDLAAGTLVVRELKAPAYEPPRAPIPPAQYQSWDVAGLGDAEITAVRTFLDRRFTLAPGPRAALAADLAARLRPLVPGVRPGLHDEQFLEYLAAAKSGATSTPVGGSIPPYS